MPTTIEVNKQSVKQLLEGGKEKPFVIPEYQRPYAWDEEQIQTLIDDLWEFTTSKDGNNDEKSTYFLGSIVSYENENGEQEIIDGQQRITSLFLLLRAIYTMLQNADGQSKKAKNFIQQIEPAIWRTDKYTGEVDYSNILLTSKVMNNEGNDILRNILKTGKADDSATDNYSKNYLLLQKLIAELSQNNPLMIYDFIYDILNKAILLPISADSQDTALTIFSTLNDRGLPLSDADIFKAKIYNQHTESDKARFIDSWKDLDNIANEADEDIQQLFYYYMFYLRALEKDNKTTTPGLRKYYSANKFKRLFQPDLMDNLFTVAKLWNVINKHTQIQDEPWTNNAEIQQALDVLSSYPNEFWKYPVTTYYLQHRNNTDFEDKFKRFLHKLIEGLLVKYLEIPTINAVKGDILKLNVYIVTNDVPVFGFKMADEQQLKTKIKNPHRNVVRMLLKLMAYNEQTTLLPDKWEIEHIFPQKWQNTYFPHSSEEDVKEKIEHIGNKLPFEKRLNIIAGNGYFSKKKKEYSCSNIIITKKMASIDVDEWSIDNIVERDIMTADTIIKILGKWNNEYKNIAPETAAQPTSEELAMIKKFKKNGWV